MMLLRRVLPYTTALLLAAIGYTGWTIYSRSAENRRIEREAAMRKQLFDQKTLNLIGSDLKITAFYASDGLICYGVANAKSVRIEPFIEPVWPSLARCIQAPPHKTTEYTLTATDGAGHSVSQTIVAGQ
jgi:hypothetical protein